MTHDVAKIVIDTATDPSSIDLLLESTAEKARRKNASKSGTQAAGRGRGRSNAVSRAALHAQKAEDDIVEIPDGARTAPKRNVKTNKIGGNASNAARASTTPGNNKEPEHDELGGLDEIEFDKEEEDQASNANSIEEEEEEEDQEQKAEPKRAKTQGGYKLKQHSRWYGEIKFQKGMWKGKTPEQVYPCIPNGNFTVMHRSALVFLSRPAVFKIDQKLLNFSKLEKFKFAMFPKPTLSVLANGVVTSGCVVIEYAPVVPMRDLDYGKLLHSAEILISDAKISEYYTVIPYNDTHFYANRGDKKGDPNSYGYKSANALNVMDSKVHNPLDGTMCLFTPRQLAFLTQEKVDNLREQAVELHQVLGEQPEFMCERMKVKNLNVWSETWEPNEQRGELVRAYADSKYPPLQ